MIMLGISVPTILARFHSARQLGIIAGLTVIVVVLMTLREKLRKYKTRNWPISVGTIEDLHLVKVDGGLNGVDYWKVLFRYKYRVQGEHEGKYSFNCTSEAMGQGAIAGLQDKTVCVHYKQSDESKSLLWEDEMWDLWWDTYWQMGNDAEEQTAN
jgi:hypothetical protein